MKKIFVLVVLACLVSTFAFAADFTVQSLKGRVEYEVDGKKVAVKTGDVLNSEVVIHTGVGASVVLKDADGKAFTIAAAKNGKIADLTSASGIRVTGTVTRTDTDAVSRTGQISTASARASDQAGEDNIAAE